MRYAFGLGGLLVTLGVIVWFMGAPGGELDQAKTAIDARQKVEPMMQQLGGKDENGNSAEQSVSLQAQRDASQKLVGLLAVNVVPGGAYDTHYGLKDYDLIVQAGPLDLRTEDEDSAKAFVLDAYTKGGTLTVVRGTQRLTLPMTTPANSPTMDHAAATPAQAPPDQPSPPQRSGNPVQDQLDAITKVPTH